jgi:hypothetical protein
MKFKYYSKLFLVVLMIGSSLFSFGQSRIQNLDLRPLLFKNFLKADILKKNGSNIQASINYNTNNQSIIFLTKDDYMELTGLEEIEQIKIDSSIFIPIEGKFYEKTDRKNLFISYSNKVVVNDVVTSKPGTEVKNARESSNSVSNVYVSQNYHSPNNLAFVKKFWMKDGNQLVEVSNVKQLARAFNTDKKAINDFLKENNLNLNNYEDVVLLLNYLGNK